jgi:uncharacterized protein
MSHQPVINAVEFAAAGAVQQGVLPLSGFPRLRDWLASDAGEVAYAVQGVRDGRGRPSLKVGARGTLQLRCQRCLENLPYEVKVESLLVLAASQAEIDAEPADVDAPDRLVAAAELPVIDLIEDELILALPYAPRHAACATRLGAGEKGKTLPFAGLKGLLRGDH